MHRIGNDIVDLTDHHARGKSRDTRFIERVFTKYEQEYIVHDTNPDVALWSLWSGKEAAYKAVSKIHTHATAAPRRYEVYFDNTNISVDENSDFVAGIVATPYDPVYIRLYPREKYVHCVGIAGNRTALNETIMEVHKFCDSHKKTSGSHESVSLLMRKRAIERLSSLLNVKSGDVIIPRSESDRGQGPPVVHVKGRKAKTDISLSHDGNFAAFAFIR